MLQSNAISSPTTYTILAMCVLSVGFLIRFLIALAIDGKKIRVDYPRALTSKPNRGSKGTAPERLRVARLPERRRELGSTIQYRYRSS
jgi:hypothetical protein